MLSHKQIQSLELASEYLSQVSNGELEHRISRVPETKGPCLLVQDYFLNLDQGQNFGTTSWAAYFTSGAVVTTATLKLALEFAQKIVDRVDKRFKIEEIKLPHEAKVKYNSKRHKATTVTDDEEYGRMETDSHLSEVTCS